MRNGIRYLLLAALGVAEGALVSIVFVPLNLILVPFLGLLWLGALLRGPAPNRIGHALCALACIATVAVAIHLPVKALDRKVGPMDYGPMTLRELERRMSRDWNIRFSFHEAYWESPSVSFRTDRPMRIRRVLEQLADATDSRLKIGYCGTGASLLYGGCPMCVILEPRTGRE